MIASNLVFAQCRLQRRADSYRSKPVQTWQHVVLWSPLSPCLSSSSRISNYQKSVPVHRDTPTVAAHYFLLTCSLRNSSLNYSIPATPETRHFSHHRGQPCNRLTSGQKSLVALQRSHWVWRKGLLECNSTANLVRMVISDLHQTITGEKWSTEWSFIHVIFIWLMFLVSNGTKCGGSCLVQWSKRNNFHPSIF